MPKFYTKEMIREQLAAMNAPQNAVVTVHSDLRKVGEVEGRGEGLLDAFIEYFTADGGLLVVPTHTWDNLSKPDTPTLDLNIAHTCIGKLTEIAAARPDAHRSMHPTHSVAVFGESAKAQLCDAVKMKEVLELIYLRCKGTEILADKEPLDEKYYI